MRTTATDKIGPWLHERVRARQKAVLTRRVAAIGVNAANGLKPRWTDMTRSEIAAFGARGKTECDDSRRTSSRRARSADRAWARADQPKMEMLSGGPRWYWPVGELNSITRPSVRATAFEIPIASLIAMPWSVGKIAHGVFASVQSMHGDRASGSLPGRSRSSDELLPWQMTNRLLAAASPAA